MCSHCRGIACANALDIDIEGNAVDEQCSETLYNNSFQEQNTINDDYQDSDIDDQNIGDDQKAESEPTEIFPTTTEGHEYNIDV